MTVGKYSTITTAATHGPDSVCCRTSIVSATAASSVPVLDTSIAKKRFRNPGSLSGASWADETLTGSPESTTDACSLRDARKDVSQPDGEELVLLLGAHGHADRLRRSEAVERADDHALSLQPLEQLAPSADVGEEEVAAGGSGRFQPVAAQNLGQPIPPSHVQLPPPRDLLRIVEARQRGGLRGRGDVERAAHLARRSDDVPGSHAPTDPQPGESVDLGEGAQHGDPAAFAEEVEPVDVVRVVDVLEVRLVEDAQDVPRQPVEEGDQLLAAVRGSRGVVRVADIDELRPRAYR